MSSKNLSWILIIALCLTSIVVASYNRLYPLRTFSSHEASEKASLLVVSELRKRVATQIYAAYPKAPLEVREILTKKKFDEVMRLEAPNLKKTIARLEKNFKKEVSSDEKYPYLLESDSFDYFDLTKNIAATGTISDTIKGSKYLNKKMLAPEGNWEPLNLHPYVGYLIHKIISLVKPQADLMYSVAFTPIFILILSIIAFFFVTRQLGCHPLISFTASIYFVMAPILVQRSSYGWYDTDPYNAFFPLLITGLILKGIHAATSIIRKKMCFLLAAVTLAVYTLFWHGWMLIFVTIVASAVVVLIINKYFLKNPAASPDVNLLLIIFSVGSFLIIGFVFGFGEFFVLFKEGWKAINSFIVPQLSLWPDLYITVGELQKVTFSKYLELIGGSLFFGISLLGVASCIGKALKNPKNNTLFTSIFIILFTLGTTLIAFGAQRFILLNLIPLSLSFAIGLQALLDLIKSTAEKKFNKSSLQKYISFAALAVITLSILKPISSIESKMRVILNPIYNETWNKAMMRIKNETPPESIINSWWTPGHFLKAMADRRVTFDGATINVPQAYWMANVLLSQDEFEAAGILRMLNNSANQSSNYLQSIGLPLSSSVEILKGLAKLPETTARLTLAQGDFKRDQIDHLLSLIYKRPPPSYVFLFNELIDSNLQFKFIGNWNIKRIEEINKDKQLLKEIPSSHSKKYVDFLWNLVGGPFKYSDPQGLVSQNSERLFFTNNITVLLKNMDCSVDSKKYGRGIPSSLFYKENGRIVEKQYDNWNLPYSVILYKTGGIYQTILLDRTLAQSLFVKLYFFDGAGLKYFKKNFEESDLTRRTVMKLFEVDWDSYEKDTLAHQ